MCEKLFGNRLYGGGNMTATRERALRIEVVMQMQVEQRKFELANRMQSALEILCRKHLVEQCARQALAGFGVARHRFDDPPLPAEILHELTGQLDGVPLDAVDAGHAEVIDSRQQMVQAMSELVKERNHFVVREHRGLAADRWREIA